MTSIFIDSFELKEEEVGGLGSLNYKYSLDDLYFGNFGGIGYSLDKSNLKLVIKNKMIATYIKRKFDIDGFGAITTLKIHNNGQYSEMIVDYTSLGEVDCCFVECTFKDLGGGDLLRSRAKVEYPVLLTDTISVPLKELPASANYQGDPVIVNDLMNHYVPLIIVGTSYEGGTSNTVEYNSTTPMFVSSQEDKILISGTIQMSSMSNTTGTYDVVMSIGGVETILDTLPIDATLELQTTTFSIVTKLFSSGEIRIFVRSSILDLGNVSQFSYLDNTIISIQKYVPSAVVMKNIRAVSYKEAFKNIINKASGGTLRLGEYIFEDCFYDHYITDNKGLQNNSSVVNLSFHKLFDELNNKYPLSFNIEDGSINIISRCTSLSCTDRKRLLPVEINRAINEDALYSSVKIGYNNWKPDSILGYLEFNSKREFYSGISAGNRALSLLNDWSSSGYLISEQIIKEKNKDEIHVIVVDKSTMKAELDERITPFGIAEPSASINLRISPTRNMARWNKFIIGDLTFATGTGNYSISSRDTYVHKCFEGTGYIDESTSPDPDKVIGNYIYTITVNKCDVDLQNIDSCVDFEYCGDLKKGYIIEIESKESDTTATIRALEIL